MTWVIGATSIFGYSLIVSDVQITCKKSGHRADVLQKTYPVGNYIAAGFAGDVPTGLSLLHYLSEILNPPDLNDNEYWDPRWLAQNWGPVAKRLYHDFSQRHPVDETHILMAGARDVPGKDSSKLGGTVGYISIFKSPDFIPEIYEGGSKVTSIGSGSLSEPHREDLEYVLNDPEFICAKGEMWRGGGHGMMIAGTVQLMVRRNPLPGVSQHFHTTLVGFGAIEQHRSPQMPDVATNWTELLSKLSDDMDKASLTAQITQFTDSDALLAVRL